MSVEIIGFITVILGLLCVIQGPAMAIYVFIASTLLGAAAAAVLTGLGSANITPAHLMLGFLTVAVLVRRDYLHRVLQGVAFPRAGFWLLLTALYATISAIVMPRLFAGATHVFAITRTEFGPGIVLTPLAPVSGNITQTIYFIGDFVCFLIIYAYAGSKEGIRTIAYACLACAALNLGFAVLDVVTYSTNTTESLAFIRNANYRMLNDTIVIGFKRIVGSFPEASAYAYATLGLFAFTAKLWLRGTFPRLNFVLAGFLLVTLIFSTSTTAYAGLGIYLVAIYLCSFVEAFREPVPKATFAFVFLAPPCAIALILAAAMDQSTWTLIQDLVDKTILTKLASDSGVERTLWNVQATANFWDTYGLGAGVGSVRASSFPISVIANIGIIGAVFYGGFLLLVLMGPTQQTDAFSAAVQSAARSACLALVIAASLAGSFIDLGLPFFVFAGLGCARFQSFAIHDRTRSAAYREHSTNRIPIPV